MKYKLKLSPADFISLGGLLLSWIGIILLLKNNPHWAILVIMMAFGCDILDGYMARRLNITSNIGRELDSYVDIFIYLVFSCLLYLINLSPNILTSIVVGFLILGFGGLRLLRFNHEGILHEGSRSYYRGVTVVHILLITIACYFLSQITTFWSDYYTTAILLIVSPLMISNYISYKVTNYWWFVLVITGVMATSMYLAYAN